MHITRPVIASVIACALLAVAAPAVSARPVDTERYLSSYGTPQATDNGVAAAEAQESYYSSYGAPAPQETSGAADWLPTALLSVALVLAAIAVIVALRRRLHTSRRRTARIAI